MKRNIILMLTWLAGMLAAHATDGLTVADASIPTGKTGSIDIELTNNDNDYAGFTFNVILPEGVHFVMDGESKPTFVKTSRFLDSHMVMSGNKGAGKGSFGCLGTDAIKGKSGVLPELVFTTTSTVEKNFPDVNFDITIEENRVVLDENNSTTPKKQTGVDVKVKRTIKPGEWNTLVLPFDLSETQVTSIFGPDVQLANYVDYDVVEEGGKVVGIQVNFEKATSITAHKPCLIQVVDPISQFTVDGVNITKNDEPFNNAMRGTYDSNTTVPANSIFLNGNSFWYSKGATKMKAFRAYFKFSDVLDEVESASAKIRFSIDEESTSIEGIATADTTAEVFTLQGISLGVQDVQSLPQGIYIIEGKKVIVK